MILLLKGLFFLSVALTPTAPSRLNRIAKAGAVPMLSLHKIDDDPRCAYRAITPRVFNSFLGWLKAEFAIVTIEELADRAPANGKPRAVLSFDDGYKDFIHNAAPILKKHCVRANQNIVASGVDSGLPPINILLQDFIDQAPLGLLREISIPGASFEEIEADRARAAERVTAHVKNKPIAEQKAILAALKPAFERFDGFNPTAMMDLAEVREMAREHEIGSHSAEHATMTFETDEYFADDVATCQTWFAGRLGFAPSIYAFPNGACHPHHVTMAQQGGFNTVLKVGEAFTDSHQSVHPRFNMYGRSVSELRFRALGGLSPLPRGLASKLTRGAPKENDFGSSVGLP